MATKARPQLPLAANMQEVKRTRSSGARPRAPAEMTGVWGFSTSSALTLLISPSGHVAGYAQAADPSATSRGTGSCTRMDGTRRPKPRALGASHFQHFQLRCALSPSLHPWLCRATSAAASSSQLQRRGERLVYPESKRAAGWVENRAEVISMRVRIKGVIGAGVSGSKGERPDTVNVQRVAAAVSRK